jgi:hypothetical protein
MEYRNQFTTQKERLKSVYLQQKKKRNCEQKTAAAKHDLGLLSKCRYKIIFQTKGEQTKPITQKRHGTRVKHFQTD